MRSFVDKLLADRPKDRILSAVCLHDLDRTRRPLSLELSCETMDDYAYPKFRTQRSLDYVRSLDHVYVLFMRAAGDAVPLLNGSGNAVVFSKKSDAEKTAAGDTCGLFFREFDRAGFEAFVRQWYRFGIIRFVLDPKTGSARTAVLQRDELYPLSGTKR
jgi:hypothetical protein